MTKIEVLDQLCDFLRDAVADLMLPVSVQKAGEVAGLRPAEIINQQESVPSHRAWYALFFARTAITSRRATSTS